MMVVVAAAERAGERECERAAGEGEVRILTLDEVADGLYSYERDLSTPLHEHDKHVSDALTDGDDRWRRGEWLTYLATNDVTPEQVCERTGIPLKIAKTQDNPDAAGICLRNVLDLNKGRKRLGNNFQRNSRMNYKTVVLLPWHCCYGNIHSPLSTPVHFPS